MLKHLKYDNNRLNAVFAKLSKYSFGAYLFHLFVINWLELRFGLNTLSFNPVLSVTLITLIVFIISFAVSAVLNKIPFVKKYIV